MRWMQTHLSRHFGPYSKTSQKDNKVVLNVLVLSLIQTLEYHESASITSELANQRLAV